MATMIELVTALSLSTLFVAATCNGLLSMDYAQRKINAKDRTYQVTNRTAAFIQDEIRQAVRVNETATSPQGTATSAVNATGLSGIPGSTGYPLLYLEIPCSNRVANHQVIYFAKASTTPWIPPVVLYRWGLTPALDGSFFCPTNIGASSTTQAVLDGIPYSTIATPCQGIYSQAVGMSSCITGGNLVAVNFAVIQIPSTIAPTVANCNAPVNRPYCLSNLTFAQSRQK